MSLPAKYQQRIDHILQNILQAVTRADITNQRTLRSGIEKLGQQEIEVIAAITTRMRSDSVTATVTADTVAEALRLLERQASDLSAGDQHGLRDAQGWLEQWRQHTDAGAGLTKYATKTYATSKKHQQTGSDLAKLFDTLQMQQEQLLRHRIALEQAESQLLKATAKLDLRVEMLNALHQGLLTHIEGMRQQRAEPALIQSLEEEWVFLISRTLRDLLTQQTVAQQAVLTVRQLLNNNRLLNQSVESSCNTLSVVIDTTRLLSR